MLESRWGTALAAALALTVALAIAGVASAGSRTISLGEGPEFSAGFSFSPKRLAARTYSPGALRLEGRLRTEFTREFVTPARELRIETDRDLSVDVEGYPTCSHRQLSPTASTREALEACREALIGRGQVEFQLDIVETLLTASSRLLVFNGGTRNGVTTLYFHAYVTIPVPAAIVGTAKIRKVNDGTHGLKTTVTIPKIVRGAGSLTSLQLTIQKRFSRTGEQASVISARCPHGRLEARVIASLADGTNFHHELIRTCSSRR